MTVDREQVRSRRGVWFGVLPCAVAAVAIAALVLWDESREAYFPRSWSKRIQAPDQPNRDSQWDYWFHIAGDIDGTARVGIITRIRHDAPDPRYPPWYGWVHRSIVVDGKPVVEPSTLERHSDEPPTRSRITSTCC